MIAGGSVAVLVSTGFAVRQMVAWRAAEAAERVCPPRPPRASAEARGTPSDRNVSPLATTGQIFVSHAWSRRVSIIDLATGKVTTLPAGIGDAHEVGVSGDGRWGVAADFGDYVGDYKFDGRRLAVFDLRHKRAARVIDLAEHRGPHDVVFLPGSPARALVTTQTSEHVIEVDVETGAVVAAIPTRAKGSHTLAVPADGSRAFTANEAEGSVSVLDLRQRTFVTKFTLGPAPAEGIAVTPDGREVWVGFRDDTVVRVADATTGAVLATLPGFVRPDRIAISPDGRRALITDWSCELVQVVDVPTRRVLGAIAGLEGAGVAKVLPDNRLAVIAMLDDTGSVLVRYDPRKCHRPLPT